MANSSISGQVLAGIDSVTDLTVSGNLNVTGTLTASSLFVNGGASSIVVKYGAYDPSSVGVLSITGVGFVAKLIKVKGAVPAEKFYSWSEGWATTDATGFIYSNVAAKIGISTGGTYVLDVDCSSAGTHISYLDNPIFTADGANFTISKNNSPTGSVMYFMEFYA